MRTARGAIAGMVGGLVGFAQVMAVAFLDTAEHRPAPTKELWALTAFVALMCLQMMAIIALSMFRVSPFVARFLGDAREAGRIEASKRVRRRPIEVASTIIIVLQRIVVVIGNGHFSIESALALLVALFPLALPATRTDPGSGLPIAQSKHVNPDPPSPSP